jgi:hypothetical protein
MVVVTARGSGRFAQQRHPTTLKSIISDRVEHCRVGLTVVMTPACYALSAAVDALQRVDQRMRREGLGPKLARGGADRRGPATRTSLHRSRRLMGAELI